MCTSSKSRSKSAKIRGRLYERLQNRVAYNLNEMSPDELKLHDCMFMDKFVSKNPDLMPNLSKHRRSREALESPEVRRTLVKIGNIFVGTPGYNWETSGFTPHVLSIVPINSEFHNAELAHIAIKSRRRSAYDLYRSRGKRRPIAVVIPTFNHPLIFSNEPANLGTINKRGVIFQVRYEK